MTGGPRKLLEGVVHARALRGDGAGPAVDSPWADWLHLDATKADSVYWLRHASGIPPLAVDGLLAPETRPRCEAIDGGLLLILRGVNLNAGADPDDMVSLRVWIGPTGPDGKGPGIVSVRLRRLMAVQDVVDALDTGCGPSSAGEAAVALAERLAARMAPTIDALDDELDALEAAMSDAAEGAAKSNARVRPRLLRLRHQALTLRRYLSPQRAALQRLIELAPDWLSDTLRQRLRESLDAVTRYVEALDTGRERAAVIQDELANAVAERLNTRMYVLSVVAAVFLPLGFVTGLLGVNVAGMPGADTPWAFAAVAGGSAGVAAVEIWLFRRLGWL
ncbi:zinc transporter ZntB [Rhodovibrio salinarum]|uniref:Zinc transporter ZntB n=1 Tax=Rhodovibrio salinarum TaxID=1087 RepID=A0A934UZ39_9PROT|nr:zinc transporter ZntB [Rhodovibrio salinarum]MBK1695935.1 zinc transporter ZntB [Rhodovibrio salinarum]